jgi:regulator of replication initiation timing
MPQYIYLIREREFIRLNEQTYKIGKTKNEPNTRLSGYPKGSEVLLFESVLDCDTVERKIIERFREKFKLETDYGAEYFSGDPQEMKAEIHNITAEERERSRAWCAEVDDKIKKLQETVETLVKENLTLREENQNLREEMIVLKKEVFLIKVQKVQDDEKQFSKKVQDNKEELSKNVNTVKSDVENTTYALTCKGASINDFIEYIRVMRPMWAIENTHIAGADLCERYYEYSGIQMDPRIFGRMLSKRLGSVKDGKKISIIKLLG